jgi:DNA repair exonuclease SbcCD ATPase subunit
MKKKLMFVVMALGVAVLFSSCGKVPQAEIDAAFAALDSAKTAGADVYLAEDFAALQDSMKAITESVEAQKSKFFASYGDIKAKLASVNEQAVAAVAKTEARKEEVKQEIATLQSEVTTLQTQNNELVAKAPKGKEGKAALEAIKADITLIDTTLGEVGTQAAAGDLMGALDKAKAAKEKAVAINTELNDVIAKYTKAQK